MCDIYGPKCNHLQSHQKVYKKLAHMPLVEQQTLYTSESSLKLIEIIMKYILSGVWTRRCEAINCTHRKTCDLFSLLDVHITRPDVIRIWRSGRSVLGINAYVEMLSHLYLVNWFDCAHAWILPIIMLLCGDSVFIYMSDQNRVIYDG